MEKRNKISIKLDRTISLDKYSDQWVAILNQKVVGNSKNFRKLWEKMKRKGIEKKVTFFPVPKKGVIHIY